MDTIAAGRWIRETLKASFPGYTIEPFPYEGTGKAIVYKVMAGGADASAFPAEIVATSILYQVVVVDDGANNGGLSADVRLMHSVLHGKSGTNADGNVFACVRETVIDIPFKSPDGRIRQQVGGLYRITVKGT